MTWFIGDRGPASGVKCVAQTVDRSNLGLLLVERTRYIAADRICSGRQDLNSRLYNDRRRFESACGGGGAGGVARQQTLFSFDDLGFY